MSPSSKVDVLIRQSELEQISSHRREIAWYKSQLDPIEKDVLHLLIAGAEVESGRFNAKLSYMRRHSVAWRAIVEAELGEDFAEQAYKSSRVIAVPQLKLVEHPPELPLFRYLKLDEE
jgi:hypothetical protein